MPVTDAGKAHLQAVNDEYRRRIVQAREDKLDADLEALDVGWVVFERQAPLADYQPRAGVVVDVQRDDDTGETQVVTVAAFRNLDREPAKRWECRTFRLTPREIGECQRLGEEGRIVKWRQLYACVAARKGPWTVEDDRLVRFAKALMQVGRSRPAR